MTNRLPRTEQRVLIVDDDAPTRAGLALVLDAAGYATRLAANGLEAFKELSRWRPDLILLDLTMPVMDGWTFRAQQLKDPAVADIPVVVLSGSADARCRSALLGVSASFRKAASGHGVLDLMGDLFDVFDRSGAGAAAT